MKETRPSLGKASDALYQITGDDSSVIEVGHRLLNDSDELLRVVGLEAALDEINSPSL